jgi:hypothetical protein
LLTATVELIMLFSTINAIENRDIATTDILVVLIHMDVEGENMHMMLEGIMAELIVKLNPQMYWKYIKTINRKKVIYVQLNKALYSMLKVAYLF